MNVESQVEHEQPRTIESHAVAIARAHVEAGSRHDFETARRSLASDVHVTVTTTQPIMSATDTTGIDAYMDGLIKFATPIVPGSLGIIGSTGDDRNALLLVTMKPPWVQGDRTLRYLARDCTCSMKRARSKSNRSSSASNRVELVVELGFT